MTRTSKPILIGLGGRRPAAGSCATGTGSSGTATGAFGSRCITGAGACTQAAQPRGSHLRSEPLLHGSAHRCGLGRGACAGSPGSGSGAGTTATAGGAASGPAARSSPLPLLRKRELEANWIEAGTPQFLAASLPECRGTRCGPRVAGPHGGTSGESRHGQYRDAGVAGPGRVPHHHRAAVQGLADAADGGGRPAGSGRGIVRLRLLRVPPPLRASKPCVMDSNGLLSG